MKDRDFEVLLQIVQRKAPSAFVEILGKGGKFVFETAAVLGLSPGCSLCLLLWLCGCHLRDCSFFVPSEPFSSSVLNLLIEYAGPLTNELEKAFHLLVEATFGQLKAIRSELQCEDIHRCLWTELPKADNFQRDSAAENGCFILGMFNAVQQYLPLLGKGRDVKVFQQLNSLISGKFCVRENVDGSEKTTGVSFVNGIFFSDIQEFSKARVDPVAYSEALKNFDEHKFIMLDYESSWDPADVAAVLGSNEFCSRDKTESFLAGLATVLYRERVAVSEQMSTSRTLLQFRTTDRGYVLLRGFCEMLRKRQRLREAYIELIGKRQFSVGRTNEEGRETVFLENVIWKRGLQNVLAVAVRLSKLHDWAVAMEGDGFVPVFSVGNVIAECFIGQAIQLVQLCAYRYSAAIGYQMIAEGAATITSSSVSTSCRHEKIVSEFKKTIKRVMTFPGCVVPIHLVIDTKLDGTMEDKVSAICSTLQLVSCLPGGEIPDSAGVLVDVKYGGIKVALFVKNNPLCMSANGWDKCFVSMHDYLHAFVAEPWQNFNVGSRSFAVSAAVLGVKCPRRLSDHKIHQSARPECEKNLKTFFRDVMKNRMGRVLALEQVVLDGMALEGGVTFESFQKACKKASWGSPELLMTDRTVQILSTFLGDHTDKIAYFSGLDSEPGSDCPLDMKPSNITPVNCSFESLRARFDSGRAAVSNVTAGANCVDLRPQQKVLKAVSLGALYRAEEKFYDQMTWKIRESSATERSSRVGVHSDNPVEFLECYADNMLVAVGRTGGLDVQHLMSVSTMESEECREIAIHDGVSNKREEFSVRSERVAREFVDYRQRTGDISKFRKCMGAANAGNGVQHPAEVEQMSPVARFRKFGMSSARPAGECGIVVISNEAEGKSGYSAPRCRRQLTLADDLLDVVEDDGTTQFLGEGGTQSLEAPGNGGPAVAPPVLPVAASGEDPWKPGDAVLTGSDEICTMVSRALSGIVEEFGFELWCRFWNLNQGTSHVAAGCLVCRGRFWYGFTPLSLSAGCVSERGCIGGSSVEGRKCLGAIFQWVALWWNDCSALDVEIPDFGESSQRYARRARAFCRRFVLECSSRRQLPHEIQKRSSSEQDNIRDPPCLSALPGSSELKHDGGKPAARLFCEQSAALKPVVKREAEAICRGLPSMVYGSDLGRQLECFEKRQQRFLEEGRQCGVLLKIESRIPLSLEEKDMAENVLRKILDLCRSFQDSFFLSACMGGRGEDSAGHCELEMFRIGDFKNGKDGYVLCFLSEGRIKVFSCFGSVAGHESLMDRIGSAFNSAKSKEDGCCWIDWMEAQLGESHSESVILTASYAVNLAVWAGLPSREDHAGFETESCRSYLSGCIDDGMLYEIPLRPLSSLPNTCSKKFGPRDSTRHRFP